MTDGDLFTGRCVGGYADGETLGCTKPDLIVPERVRDGASWSPFAPPAAAEPSPVLHRYGFKQHAPTRVGAKFERIHLGQWWPAEAASDE